MSALTRSLLKTSQLKRRSKRWENRFLCINTRLEPVYGMPSLGNVRKPEWEIFYILLSSKTTEVLYKQTYRKIDSKLFIQNKYALLKYTHWIILIDDGETITGFFLCSKHKKGIKLGLTAANDLEAAKEAIIDLNRKALNIPTVFGEVSPPLEKVLIGHVPEVEAKVAKQVLSPTKQITRIHKDRKHYWRKIKNIGERKKMMVGKPNL